MKNEAKRTNDNRHRWRRPPRGTSEHAPNAAQSLENRLFGRERWRRSQKSFVSVVGVWRIENDGNNKVLVVDGRQWKQGQTRRRDRRQGGARLYGDRYAEFLDPRSSLLRTFRTWSPRMSTDFRDGGNLRALRRHFRAHRSGLVCWSGKMIAFDDYTTYGSLHSCKEVGLGRQNLGPSLHKTTFNSQCHELLQVSTPALDKPIIAPGSVAPVAPDGTPTYRFAPSRPPVVARFSPARTRSLNHCPPRTRQTRPII